jgi:regulator of protease activity HflC (stomatin/prohibitin superfamily)
LSIWRNPVKLAATTLLVCACCFLLFITFLFVTLNEKQTTTGPPVLATLFFVVSLLSGILAFQLFTAKQRAIAERGRPVPLLFGFALLVAWEQNEGLIFLRDKRIRETIYGPKHGGGFRLIYPLLGEEFRAKVPLTLQLTWFRDERVLTRESIQMVVKVAFWWKVSDLEAYFFRIDQEAHALRDGDVPGSGSRVVARPTARGRLASAELWLRTDVEASLRRLISDTSTFLIVSKRAASHLHAGADDPSSPADLHPATPDVLARHLEEDLCDKVNTYGLELERVEVQEVQLPPAIQQAVDEVWVASTQPTKSRHEAEALRHRLEVLCNLMGKEAVGVSEIVSKLPPGTYMNNPLSIVADLIDRLAKTPPSPAPTPSGMLPPAGSPGALPAPPPGASGT